MLLSRVRPVAAVLVLGATLLVTSAAGAPVAVADVPPLVPACPMPSTNAPIDVVDTMEEGDCYVDFTLDPYTDTYLKAASGSMSPSHITFGDGSDQPVSVSFAPHHVWELPELDGTITPWTVRGQIGAPEWPCASGCGPGTVPLVRTRFPGGEWSDWSLRTSPPFTMRSVFGSCAPGSTTCSYTLDWLWGSQGEAVPDMQVIMPMPWNAYSPDGFSLFSGRTTWFPISVTGGPGTGHPPEASFDVHPYGSSGTQWQFLSTSTDPDGDDQLFDWRWDFGDGIPVYGESVIKTFPVGTVRDVTLTVTDITGRTGQVTQRFGGGDLDISQVTVDPDPLEPGEDATVTVRVRNHGTTDVTGVAPTLSGITPTGGLTVVGAPSPASTTITPGATAAFTYTVRAGPVDEVSVQVGAAGTAGGSAVSADPVTRVIDVRSTGLAVALTTSDDAPATGEQVTVTATVTNTGDDAIDDVAPGTLAIDPAVAPPGSVLGPVPSGSVDLAAGATTTFTWSVTFASGGPHQLEVDVGGTAAGGDPVSSSASLTIDVETDARVTVAVVLVPEDPPPHAGATFPVEIRVSNVGNVAIDDLSLDLTSIPVAGGAVVARVGGAAALTGSLAAGATRSAQATYRATSGGKATFRAGVAGVDHATGDPVSSTVDRTIDITSPQLLFGSPDETGVVRDVAVGTAGTLQGRFWDPDGGPITVTWGDEVVATIAANERFDRLLALPPFPDPAGTDRCAPAALVGRQGDVSASLQIAGTPVERILASDDVDLVAAGTRQAVGTGVRCKGELFTAHTAPTALLATEALPDGYREVAASGGGPPVQQAYEGTWVQAADIELLGVYGREIVIEMPRGGSGPLTRRTVASTTFVNPANVDPRHDTTSWTSVNASYVEVESIDAWLVAEHPLTFGRHVTCDGSLLFGVSWVWFTKGLDTTKHPAGCILAANEAMRINGPIKSAGIAPEDDEGPRRGGILTRRLELLRADSHVTTVGAAAAPGDTEVEVGPGGDLTVGDDVWIGPETTRGEVGEVVGFGSIILSAGLVSPHQPGEQILNLDGLARPAGVPSGTDPPSAAPGDPPAPGAHDPGAAARGPLARTGASSPINETAIGLLAVAIGTLLLVLARLRSTSRPS